MQTFLTRWNASTLRLNLRSIANYEILKKYEHFEQLPTAIWGIPKIADDIIPEITRRFQKSSEDFPTVTKALGTLEGIRKAKGKFLRDYKLHSESCDCRCSGLAENGNFSCTPLYHRYFKINWKCFQVIGHTTQLSIYESATLTTDQRLFNH